MAVRYERQRPGEMLHLDIKTAGRIARPGHRVTGNRRDSVEGIGWEHLHVAIDNASRLAYTEMLPGTQGRHGLPQPRLWTGSVGWAYGSSG